MWPGATTAARAIAEATTNDGMSRSRTAARWLGALQARERRACVALGYDESQARRRELVKMLTGVQQGGPFADELLGWVVLVDK